MFWQNKHSLLLSLETTNKTVGEFSWCIPTFMTKLDRGYPAVKGYLVIGASEERRSRIRRWHHPLPKGSDYWLLPSLAETSLPWTVRLHKRASDDDDDDDDADDR